MSIRMNKHRRSEFKREEYTVASQSKLLEVSFEI